MADIIAKLTPEQLEALGEKGVEQILKLGEKKSKYKQKYRHSKKNKNISTDKPPVPLPMESLNESTVPLPPIPTSLPELPPSTSTQSPTTITTPVQISPTPVQVSSKPVQVSSVPNQVPQYNKTIDRTKQFSYMLTDKGWLKIWIKNYKFINKPACDTEMLFHISAIEKIVVSDRLVITLRPKTVHIVDKVNDQMSFPTNRNTFRMYYEIQKRCMGF